jgi:hypothetical protein
MAEINRDINVGDVIQTTICSRGGYVGRKVMVHDIQTDIEPANDLYRGVVVTKKGGGRKTDSHLLEGPGCAS